MFLGPIFRNELSTEARGRRLYLIRSLAASAGALHLATPSRVFVAGSGGGRDRREQAGLSALSGPGDDARGPARARPDRDAWRDRPRPAPGLLRRDGRLGLVRRDAVDGRLGPRPIDGRGGDGRLCRDP